MRIVGGSPAIRDARPGAGTHLFTLARCQLWRSVRGFVGQLRLAQQRAVLLRLLRLAPALVEANKTPIHCVVGENQPEQQRYLFRVLGPPLPLRFAVIAGEAVHQLRTTFDHIIWALAQKNGVDPSLRITFPVSETKEKYEKAIKNGAIKGVSRDMYPHIESLQPYRSKDPENHIIKMVHDLDVRDKHQLLVVTTTAMQFGSQIGVDASGGGRRTVHRRRRPGTGVHEGFRPDSLSVRAESIQPEARHAAVPHGGSCPVSR